MKIEQLKKRLKRNRPMTSVTINIPEDVVEDLKRIAPLLGFSDYQPLIRAYIGQGLRQDLERFEIPLPSSLKSPPNPPLKGGSQRNKFLMISKQSPR